MKTIRHIGVLLLLLVFLFGTSGLSVLHHICNSSKTTTVTLYPELSPDPGSSCCEAETTGNTCCIPMHEPGHKLPANFNASPCCKSITSFLKLEFNSLRAEKQICKIVLAEQHLLSVSPDPGPMFEQLFVKPAHFQFYSPPLFGKLLLQYLHQLKIPVQPSFA